MTIDFSKKPGSEPDKAAAINRDVLLAERLGVIRQMDSDLLEGIGATTTLERCSVEEALEMAQEYNDLYRTALYELIMTLQSKHFEVDIKFLQDVDERPIFVITPVHYQNGNYGIPNIDSQREKWTQLGRNESLNDQRKRVMTDEGDTHFRSPLSGSFSQIGQFDQFAPLRLVISPGFETEKPYDFNVQYSPAAFKEAFNRMESHVLGFDRTFNHLFSGVLVPQLREDLNDLSGNLLGSLHDPEILHDESFVNKGIVSVVAACPISDEQSKIELKYALMKDDCVNPFPSVISLQD